MPQPKTAWLIRLGTAARPLGFYLRTAHDGAFTWSSDPFEGDRFPDKLAAQRSARKRISGVFHAVEVAMPAGPAFDYDDPDLDEDEPEIEATGRKGVVDTEQLERDRAAAAHAREFRRAHMEAWRL